MLPRELLDVPGLSGAPDAKILEILRSKLRQRLPVDLVLAKSGLVSLEAKTLQPFGHINRHFPSWILRKQYKSGRLSKIRVQPALGRWRSSMAEFRTLRAGIFLPPFHPNDEDPLLCMERDFELMQWLDKLDYAEAWIGEHHSGGYEIYGQPELFIATAAERTPRIRLGTGVISLPYHHPLMEADRIVQLDYQTRGRAMFGFGPGALSSDAHMLGVPVSNSRDRMAEALDIIVRLLDGETVTAHSDWYTLRDARSAAAPALLFEAAPASGDRQRGHPLWRQARRAL